jgi:hypothetical protein
MVFPLFDILTTAFSFVSAFSSTIEFRVGKRAMKRIRVNPGMVFVIALALVAFLIPLTGGGAKAQHESPFARRIG